ncbi:class I SAM-dependent methyltransferase [bacterium BD-1]|nr:class I SAM-dependent methyltransferase [Ottowia caeni]
MQLSGRSFISALAVAVALVSTAVYAQKDSKAKDTYTPMVGQEGKDVVWVPTSQALVDRMLEMAQLTPKDRLVDLGSGDGVTVITAAKRGIKARGIEYNPDMVALSKKRAQAAGVSGRATFVQGDIFQTDFSDATVVTLFLLPNLNIKLRPILLNMPPGTRIIANTFDMADWEPDETAEVTKDCETYCRALKWIVPAKVQGTWEIDGKKLALTQNFQMLKGALGDGAAPSQLSDGRLEGSRIRFSIGTDRYVGEVRGDGMQGTINGSQRWQARRMAGS